MNWEGSQEPNYSADQAYPWTDLEGWNDLWDEFRAAYPISRLREILEIPLAAGESEPWTDGVLLLSHHLTGQTEDLRAAREWFLERIGSDHLDVASLLIPGDPCAVGDDPNSSTYTEPPIEVVDQGEKITDMTPGREKSPICPMEKSPTCPRPKSPPDTIPVVLRLVVSVSVLKKLLRQCRQHEWCTSVRLNGLLLLLDFILRNSTRSVSRISATLSHGYVSAIKRAKSTATEREPLRVLEKIGVLERVSSSAFGPYAKSPAAYRIASQYQRRTKTAEINVTPLLATKLKTAIPRKERRLNAKHRWRKPLLEALGRVGLSPQGMNLALAVVLEQPSKRKPLEAFMNALQGKRRTSISCSAGDHIHTFVSNCPRELKGELTIGGEAVALCDIRAAHFCVLPRVLLDQLDRDLKFSACSGIEADIRRETAEMVEYFSKGDIYRALSEDPTSDIAREAAKSQALKVLNWKSCWARNSQVYRRLARRYPAAISILERYKAKDHRNIHPPLRYYTALVIRSSLLRLQAEGVEAIPDSDCIICPARHKAVVCRVIGEEMFKVSGVRCRVGDIHFEPKTKGGC